MAIIRTYDLIRFDPEKAVITINVIATETVSGYSRTYSDLLYWLPVADDGTVPSGGALYTLLDQWVTRVAPDEVILRDAKLAENPVTNASSIYQLTSEVEPGEASGNIFAGLIPVVVFPDRVYTPSGNVFTRSIIAPVGGNNAAPSPDDVVFPADALTRVGTTYILDNGNVGDGAELRFARGNISDDYATVAITNSWAENLIPPTYIIEQYPYVFRQPLPPGNFDDYCRFFYLEHEPLTINGNYGTAWFHYS